MKIPIKALLVLVAMVVAMPVLAADDHEGFFLELEYSLLTPGNVNTPIATSSASFNSLSIGNSVNDVAWTNWDDAADPGFTVGYSWGSRGRLSVSYWSYSDESQSSGTFNLPNYNWFGIGPTSLIGVSYYFYPFSWDFQQDIDASSIDVNYEVSRHPNDDLTVNLGVGLRVADFEDEVQGTYTIPVPPLVTNCVTCRLPAVRTIDSDGFGFTGTIGVDYDLNALVGISTEMRVGFVTTDVDSSHFIIDLDGYYYTAGTLWVESNSAEDQVSLMMEFGADVTFQISDMIRLDVGYVYRSWSDIAEPNLSRGGVTSASPPVILGEDRNRFAWSGPRFNLSFRF